MSSEYYGELLRQMPEKQRNVFLAIAAEGRVKTTEGKLVVPCTSDSII